jgi:hypothetical protein
LSAAPAAVAWPAVATGMRVRLLAPPLAGEPRGYVFDCAGTVTSAGCDERGRMWLTVRWDSGREATMIRPHWLVPEDAPRDDGGCLACPPPDAEPANFLASVARYGCAWSGDAREVSAWHAEDPDRSGWWQATGRPPVFSIGTRLACERGS